MDWSVWLSFFGVGSLAFCAGWASAFRGRNDTPQDRNREMDAHAPGSAARLQRQTPVELTEAEKDAAWVIGSREVICSDPEPAEAGLLRVQVAGIFWGSPICYVDHDGRSWFGKADAEGWVTLKRDRPTFPPMGQAPEGMRLHGLAWDGKGKATAYFVAGKGEGGE